MQWISILKRRGTSPCEFSRFDHINTRLISRFILMILSSSDEISTIISWVTSVWQWSLVASKNMIFRTVVLLAPNLHVIALEWGKIKFPNDFIDKSLLQIFLTLSNPIVSLSYVIFFDTPITCHPFCPTDSRNRVRSLSSLFNNFDSKDFSIDGIDHIHHHTFIGSNSIIDVLYVLVLWSMTLQINPSLKLICVFRD